MLLKSIQIRNLLSFGADTEPLGLRNLNVFIGPNGSGKSNLLEVIGLLKAAPGNLSAPIKETGGVRDWLHQPRDGKRRSGMEASIGVVVINPRGATDLRHTLFFAEHGRRFEVIDETVAYDSILPGKSEPYFFYKFQRGAPVLNELTGSKEGRRRLIRREVRPWGEQEGAQVEREEEFQSEQEELQSGQEEPRELSREEVRPEESILSQVKDPTRYPELGLLSREYPRILMLRDWVFGRYTPPRQEQRLGLPNDFLTDACDNLPLVLAEILPSIEDELIGALQALYPRITGVYTKPSGDRLQLYFKEGKRLIPATRLSDGTLRYLTLLTALLHPNPAPLVCIDEPELGLHPDVIPSLAELLIESSRRMQLIVTTHSDILVDALQASPESIVTVEGSPEGTRMRRLQEKELEEWLKKYSLGEIWTRGEIGGTRW